MKNRTVNKVGRPYLPLEEKRRVRSIKMSDKEWEAIQNLAAKETMSASKYIREKVLSDR
jgi:predicted DNA binding CopG/RHH family protein